MTFLQLNNLQKSYGANAVVKQFDLSIERGEFITFLGPSPQDLYRILAI